MDTPKSDKEMASPPWGRWEVLLDEPAYKVKRITVLPGKRLSYQKHFKRREHWMVVEGKGVVTIDGKECPSLERRSYRYSSRGGTPYGK